MCKVLFIVFVKSILSSTPFNKQDLNVLNKYKNLISKIYEEQTKKEITESIFIEFSKKVKIEIYDIENGMPYEKNVLLYLSFKISGDPYSFWSMIIQKCLSIASNRQSIDKEFLNEKYGQYIKQQDENENNKKYSKKLFEYAFRNEIKVDKDIILAKSEELSEMVSEDEDNNLYIFEIFRFNENGKINNIYQNNDCLILNNGIHLEVMYRGSTYLGLQRCIESGYVENDKNITINPSNRDDLDNKYAENHKRWLKDKLLEKENQMHCLHCGKPISNNDTFIV